MNLAYYNIKELERLQNKILSHLANFGIIDNIEQTISTVNFVDIDGKPYKELYKYLIGNDRNFENKAEKIKSLYNEVIILASPIEMMPLYVSLIEINIKISVLDFLHRKAENELKIINQKLILDAIIVVKEDDFDCFKTIDNLITFFQKNEIQCQEIVELRDNIITKASRIKSNEIIVNKLKDIVNQLEYSNLKIEVKILLKSALIIQQKDHLPAMLLTTINTLRELQ